MHFTALILELVPQTMVTKPPSLHIRSKHRLHFGLFFLKLTNLSRSEEQFTLSSSFPWQQPRLGENRFSRISSEALGDLQIGRLVAPWKICFVGFILPKLCIERYQQNLCVSICAGVFLIIIEGLNMTPHPFCSFAGLWKCLI